MNPATEMLRRLRRMGFAGQRILDSGGALNALHYSRALPRIREVARIREVVLVWAENEALAYRTTDTLDELNPLAQPHPGSLLWRHTGDVVSVVHALLSQPAPGSPFGPDTTLPVWTPPEALR